MCSGNPRTRRNQISKHTPGPWSIYFNSQDDLVIRKLFADGQEAHAVARCNSGIDNALLIAAAAELLAEQAGAYWLMDAIASHLDSYKEEGFVVAKFLKYGEGWLLQLEDGNDRVLAQQTIEYSDFPLPEIAIYLLPQDTYWVLLLPSEY